MQEQQQALETLVREIFAPWEPQISWILDEVVVHLKPQHIQEACRIAKTDPRLDFSYLRCLSVVDYKDRFQVVYHLYSVSKRHKLVFKVDLPVEQPIVPTVTPVWRGANWHEREATELFGITFEGHPKPDYLLLYPGFEGYPMRKSYPFYAPEGQQPKEEHGKAARHR